MSTVWVFWLCPKKRTARKGTGHPMSDARKRLVHGGGGHGSGAGEGARGWWCSLFAHVDGSSHVYFTEGDGCSWPQVRE